MYEPERGAGVLARLLAFFLPAPVSDAALLADLRHEQIGAITRHVSALNISRLGLAAVSLLLLAGQVPDLPLALWAFAFAAKLVIDERQWRRHHRAATAGRSSATHRRALVLDAVLSALTWCALLLFLLFDLPLKISSKAS